MKHLQKILVAIIAVCTFAVALAFAGCGKRVTISNSDDGTAQTVEIVAKKGLIEFTDTTSLYDYMVALKDDGQLTFEASNSSYGYYIDSVEGVANLTESATHGWSWMIYTDLVTLYGDSTIYSTADYGTYEYNGKSYNSASYGCSYLPCAEGYTYLLVYSEWSY